MGLGFIEYWCLVSDLYHLIGEGDAVKLLLLAWGTVGGVGIAYLFVCFFKFIFML